MSNEKCIIDNWSLEHTGFLLDNTSDIHLPNSDEFQNRLGGLSNYINALLLYEEPGYLKNGFETEWTRFEWFEQNATLFFKPIDPSFSSIDWNSPESYSDNGIENYLVSSELFGADLYISPERSAKLIQEKRPEISDNLIATLREVDNLILKKKDESWYENVRIGIQDNFQLPALTQYVLSQASNIEDLLTVIMQLKKDNKISRLKRKIGALTKSTKSSRRVQIEIESMISDSFGLKSNSDNSWSIQISALFLSVSKSFNIKFFNRKEHLVFLKDIVGLRAEVGTLQNDIERIFRRSLK